MFSTEIYHLVKSFAGLYYRKFGGCSYLKDKMLHSAVAKGIIIGDSDNNENNDVDHTCHDCTKQTNGPSNYRKGYLRYILSTDSVVQIL